MNDKLYQDVLLLTSGEVIKGEIVKFGKNSFKVESIDKNLIKVENKEVAMVAVAQDMTSGEKYRLGMLDGKRYAINKGGNFAVGFFAGLIGTAIVYVSSEQMPSNNAINGSNKAIVDDANYLLGYSKGAKSKAGKNALLGTLSSVVLVLITFKGTFY